MTLRGPVRQTPLVEQIAAQFRSLISSGEWQLDTKIPGEKQLADDLGVSRGTIREALRSLTMVGLLEARVGDGTYVRATDELAGVLTRDATLGDLSEVLEARAGLEAASARLAAARIGDADRTTLTDALAVRQRAHDSDDLAAYVAADAAFHRAVIQTSGNSVLLRLFDALAQSLSQSILRTAELPEDLPVQHAHDGLVAAIVSGDPDAAAAAAYKLVDAVRDSPAGSRGLATES